MHRNSCGWLGSVFNGDGSLTPLWHMIINMEDKLNKDKKTRPKKENGNSSLAPLLSHYPHALYTLKIQNTY